MVSFSSQLSRSLQEFRGNTTEGHGNALDELEHVLGRSSARAPVSSTSKISIRCIVIFMSSLPTNLCPRWLRWRRWRWRCWGHRLCRKALAGARVVWMLMWVLISVTCEAMIGVVNIFDWLAVCIELARLWIRGTGLASDSPECPTAYAPRQQPPPLGPACC